MSKILVTSYKNPDLDGCVSMVAYAELLRRQGKDAVAGYFGEPLPDARFGFELFGVDLPDKVSDLKYDEVVLVDMSNIKRLDQSVDPRKVTEIIDHHEPRLNDFPNAKAQIEYIGAAATLVVEKFYNLNVMPGEKLGKLLALAIIHGTLNFKAPVTSKKDRDLYNWLNQSAKLSQSDINQLFEVMTTIDKPLFEYFRDDFKDFESEGVKFGIVSIDVFGLKRFVAEKKDETLAALTRLKTEFKLDYIWFGCVDLGNGSSYLLTLNRETAKLLEKALMIDFENNEAFIPNIVMRKQHSRQMTEYLRNNK